MPKELKSFAIGVSLLFLTCVIVALVMWDAPPPKPVEQPLLMPQFVELKAIGEQGNVEVSWQSVDSTQYEVSFAVVSSDVVEYGELTKDNCQYITLNPLLNYNVCVRAYRNGQYSVPACVESRRGDRRIKEYDSMITQYKAD